MERIPQNQNYFKIHNMHIPQSESFYIQVRGSSTETLRQVSTLQLQTNLNLSAMNLFTRFRKLLMRFLFSLPSGKSSGTSSSVVPKQKNCDRFEPPKTSCSSYYSSHSHYTEAIADCIEFFNKSSQQRTSSGRKTDDFRSLPINSSEFLGSNDVLLPWSWQIRFILLQNRQGKTRLAKYYVPLEDSEKHKVEYEVHRLVVNRDPKFTNFVEFRTHKVIYRRYAGLFFSLCVDITDNELAYLESIHLFVEILDHFFSNVCELDLVFNFHKVYLILDEFILAGELQETSKKAIIERMGELEKLD
ncbi:hypothetical protein HRI_001918200 [Hibiscus trionum]|uniref:AP-2 complex subunit sigma n=1 Tax=Hibiscus trionum TaxID=183268 RepID=A0A9W7LZX5_HIBTR|nr:hypothetical protein HRI_001918200 [Hibiscus trionum]